MVAECRGRATADGVALLKVTIGGDVAEDRGSVVVALLTSWDLAETCARCARDRFPMEHEYVRPSTAMRMSLKVSSNDPALLLSSYLSTYLP